jgi:hypothetical protein
MVKHRAVEQPQAASRAMPFETRAIEKVRVDVHANPASRRQVKQRAQERRFATPRVEHSVVLGQAVAKTV